MTVATPFTNTLRSLANDSSRAAFLFWACVSVLLALWAAWFVTVTVEIYEISQSATIQVERALHPVTTEITGVITATNLTLGKKVAIGDVLVTMDTQDVQIRLQEARAAAQALAPQMEALKRQIDAEEATLKQFITTLENATEQAKSKHHQARVDAQFAQEKWRRMDKLNTASQIAQIELLRVSADAQAAQAAADAAAFEVRQLRSESASKQQEKRAAIEALQRELVALNGQSEVETARLARLQRDLEKLVIRSPVEGEIVEIAPLAVGAFVNSGGVFGHIAPRGNFKVVADFPPERVIGRVHAGNKARMRLQGFPWAQYGSVPLTVTRMASEIHEGTVRIEFLPASAAGNFVPLQHGMPGVVEIEVEQATPAQLVLRSAGYAWSNSEPSLRTVKKPSI